MPRFRYTAKVINEIGHRVKVGQSAAEIAEALGVSLGSLKVTCSRLAVSLRNEHSKRGGRHMDPFRAPPEPPIPVRVSVEARARLQLAAERRGVTVNELSTTILQTVVDERIVDAVLDD